MLLDTKLMVLFCSCVVFMSQSVRTAAYRVDRSSSTDLDDPLLTLALLEKLIDDIEMQPMARAVKRRYDAGYGGRYGAASRVGAKLMALKQAADWNGPGRKRRSVRAATRTQQ
ncbi:hypothetical protein NP493_78g04031 [Ridgeia piscesae]|uniref:Uncharacterized protein n=1 Tax=Ridgeia piscesae TaxID=27915 RepID=A0AAD9UII2_RIDPI|nr:hypothetical protein NP493_78g04031 [Ridgeia piscesae]